MQLSEPALLRERGNRLYRLFCEIERLHDAEGGRGRRKDVLLRCPM